MAAASDGSLEQTRRAQQVLNHLRSDLPGMVDALEHSDVNVRNAAAQLMPTTGSILESVTNADLSARQRDTLGNFLQTRNTRDELRRLYDTSGGIEGTARDVTSARQALGYAMLFDRDSIPERSADLGANLARLGPHAHAEAVRRLEAGLQSNSPQTQMWALSDLAGIRAQQNNPQAFLDTMRRLNATITNVENAGDTYGSLSGIDRALQNMQRAIAKPTFAASSKL